LKQQPLKNACFARLQPEKLQEPVKTNRVLKPAQLLNKSGFYADIQAKEIK
jgi:hypothetical protein